MKLKIIITLIVGIMMYSTITNAAKFEIYRDALRNKTFTIKYEIVQPPIRDSFKFATIYEDELINYEDMILDSQPHNGIVVEDGADNYSEIVYGAHQARLKQGSLQGDKVKTVNIDENGLCNLTKNGERFTFRYDVKNNQKKYYGSYADMLFFGMDTKSSKVKANENNTVRGAKVDPYQNMIDEYNYGTPALTQALAAIMPPERIVANLNTPIYKFVSSGSLNGGLTYEDFSAEKNGTFYAIRYYFSGSDMVKIATVSYTKDGNSISDYKKSIIEIIAFSTTPDKSYLSLPSSLKDVTKRDEKDGAK